MKDPILKTFEAQKAHRWTVSQSTACERIEKLKKLKVAITEAESDLKAAMAADFKKPAAEVEITELFPVLEEINFAIKNLSKWMKPKSVCSPLALLGTRTEIYYEAKGVVLVLAPWNYPFQLFLNPIIAAVAAGNCVIGRSSEKVPATSKYMKSLLEKIFSPNEVAVFDGGIDVAEYLLTLPFDHFFFTGSTEIGKKVMRAAAEHLATVTLELGGKSPTIVLEDADLEMAAQRIAWAKCLNAGQTCVAPDYVFVPTSMKAKFLDLLKWNITNLYGSNSNAIENSKDFTRIVDEKSFQRLSHLIDESLKAGGNISTGNQRNQKDHFISPTIVDGAKPNVGLMSQEIFGPILPVMTYENLDEVLSHIQNNGKPLALYIFGKNKTKIEMILKSTTSGAAVINHLMLQFINPYSPVGGVGASGQGSYHGQYGFKAFSHERAVLRQSPVTLTGFLLPPFETSRAKFGLWFLKLLSR